MLPHPGYLMLFHTVKLALVRRRNSAQQFDAHGQRHMAPVGAQIAFRFQ